MYDAGTTEEPPTAPGASSCAEEPAWRCVGPPGQNDVWNVGGSEMVNDDGSVMVGSLRYAPASRCVLRTVSTNGTIWWLGEEGRSAEVETVPVLWRILRVAATPKHPSDSAAFDSSCCQSDDTPIDVRQSVVHINHGRPAHLLRLPPSRMALLHTASSHRWFARSSIGAIRQ